MSLLGDLKPQLWSVGWMSIDEMIKASVRLGLTMEVTTDWKRFLMSRNTLMLLLHSHHYYLRFPNDYIFDSAGAEHAQLALLSMFDSNCVVNTKRFQAVGSTLCGQFCLIAASLYTSIHDKSQIFAKLDQLLPRLDVNEFLATWFAYHWQLGEEFYDVHYTVVTDRFRKALL